MHFLKLIRPAQWVKNAFVFLPIFFDRKLFDTASLVPVILAFAAFCMISGAVYCFNDIRDVEADRLHPRKCRRPIASGRVSIVEGYIVMAVCLIVAAILVSLLPSTVWWLSILYLLMNIFYSIKLKHIALIDTFILAIGFVVRIFVGGVSADIFVSHWIVMMTFLLALFLALAKRRDDVVIYNETGVAMRRHIVKYNKAFLDMALTLVSTMIVVCYVMYTVSPEVISRIGSKYLYATTIFVLLGLLRYMQITVVEARSGSPTIVLRKDRIIQVCILLWSVWYGVLLYL
jgi:4-hydroxybenzoate polyprenyltransferase